MFFRRSSIQLTALTRALDFGVIHGIDPLAGTRPSRYDR